MTMTAHADSDRLFRSEMLPHMDLLYNYAYHMTNNADDAKDLLQETYLKAFRFITTFRHGSNAKAWLFRILKNAFINEYRKKQRSPKAVEYLSYDMQERTVEEFPLPGNDLRKEIYDHLLSDDVVNAMDALTDEFRTIIILSDIEGMSYAEISVMLSLPLGTVRSRLHRARKLLQERLYPFVVRTSYVTKGSLALYRSGHPAAHAAAAVLVPVERTVLS